ncbi:hypothetical protein G6F31_018856 [Rhizopus arrhizus]|nr:hypothetical protein G6F31_018856 [Rhizopus arrhizus]
MARHAARQAGLGQRALWSVHRRRAGPSGQPLPAPGPAIGRSTGAAGGRQLHLCGRVAHAARVLQPVGRLRQRVGAGESCQRPGIGDGPDPLDPGQRTLRCPHVGATRPQRHEGGGRSRLDQRHASGGG